MTRVNRIGRCVPCVAENHEECANSDPSRLLGCRCCPEREVPLAERTPGRRHHDRGGRE